MFLAHAVKKQGHIAQQTPVPATFFPGEGCSKGHPWQKMGWKTCSPKPCVSGRAEEARGLLLRDGDVPSPCKKVSQWSRASYRSFLGCFWFWPLTLWRLGKRTRRHSLSRKSLVSLEREGAVSASRCPSDVCRSPRLSVVCRRLHELRRPEPAVGSMTHVCCLLLEWLSSYLAIIVVLMQFVIFTDF